MKLNDKLKKTFYDWALTLIITAVTFGISVVLQNILAISEHTTTVFVFAVFLVSLLTDGYLCGIAATLIAVLGINFAFNYPYFEFNFTIPENAVSAVVMLIIAIMTSTLTTKLKKWEALRSESEVEKHRANLMRAVSHDLRTPLTTIYGSSSAILENYSALTNEQKKNMIEGIKQDSEWLCRIVENLLFVTGLQNGSLKLIKTPTMPIELADAVYAKFKKRYPDVTPRLEICEEPVFVPMDALLIEQVIVNLLDNAVQHAYGMSELTLRIEISEKKALFSVTDDGCGIARDRLAEIYEGKLVSRGVADDKKRNAGIGLSVCSSIIKAHGSELLVECPTDGGTRVSFALEVEEISDEQQI